MLELVLGQGPGVARGLIGVLERVCGAATAELGLVGSVVTLMPAGGAHVVSAASNDEVRRLEEGQFGLGEGPTRDAYAARRPVLEPSLETSGWARWPGFAPLASAAGVGAVCGLPLQLGAAIFGVLTLYLPGSGGLRDQDLATALDFAQFTTEMLVDSSIPGAGEPDPDLMETLDAHGEIYQAQGMVMVDLGVSLVEALARMRAHAFASGQDLSTLANEILAGRAVIPRDES